MSESTARRASCTATRSSALTCAGAAPLRFRRSATMRARTRTTGALPRFHSALAFGDRSARLSRSLSTTYTAAAAAPVCLCRRMGLSKLLRGCAIDQILSLFCPRSRAARPAALRSPRRRAAPLHRAPRGAENLRRTRRSVPTASRRRIGEARLRRAPERQFRSLAFPRETLSPQPAVRSKVVGGPAIGMSCRLRLRLRSRGLPGVTSLRARLRGRASTGLRD